MAFPPVPRESKNQINKAGQTLIEANSDTLAYLSARKLADKCRACHAYPINTFQATLRDKLRDYSDEPLVAQRLKRMPTIVDKLKRYPAMKLTTMQDIGGSSKGSYYHLIILNSFTGTVQIKPYDRDSTSSSILEIL